MRIQTIRFLAIFLTALDTGAGMAHLLELPNKMGLSKLDYFAAQQIYRGWAWLGALAIAALAFTLLLLLRERGHRTACRWSALAFFCLVAAQAVFWLFTFPVNLATAQWSMLPANWLELRVQWEYSHAGGAILHLVALASLIRAVLSRVDDASSS
jgi:hypothetical protein